MYAALFSQQAYLVGEQVAVFYPAAYDASQHQPSPVFVTELVPQGGLPSGWKLVPHYSTEGNKSVVTIPLEEGIDLYGTGEVYGPLRRNGEEVGFWNKDNYGYLAEKGRRNYQSHPWVLGVRQDGSAFGVIADNTWRGTLRTDDRSRCDA